MWHNVSCEGKAEENIVFGAVGGRGGKEREWISGIGGLASGNVVNLRQLIC